MHIFISYAKQDTRELAFKVQDVLMQLDDVSVWMDASLEPASSWASQIQQEIDQCDCVIVLLSPDVNRPAQKRSFVLTEIDYAQTENKHIIPVMAVETKIPLQLAGIQYIDLATNQAVGIEELVRAVGRQGEVNTPSIHPAFLEYEESYRNQFALRHGTIIPPIFHAARHKFPINDLYVAPNFVNPQEKNLIDFTKFAKNIHRTVLLAHPGVGKSTLSKKLGCDLASHGEIGTKKNLVPILITVREYGEERKHSNWSIFDFIRLKANSDYQVQPPDGVFKFWLENAQALVIFDGLDELLDTSYREVIVADIENFCNLYPTVPVLITSRETGYDQAPLNPKLFKTYRLAEFNEPQIREYITKWFSIENQTAEPVQPSRISQFLKELKAIPPELNNNPLLLALICNLYQGETYIPRNRPDIYEKCANLLFQHRDRERSIGYDPAFETYLNPIILHLAHWIYGNGELEGGVTESKLVSETTSYLLEHYFEDHQSAAVMARKFIEFCTGRAWVFTDTGITRDGDPLYQFTHRTFLEYFAARALIRIHRTPEALLDKLYPHIIHQEWSTVIELAFQGMVRDAEGAGDYLLITLINRAEEVETSQAINILKVVIGCLSVMAIKPRIVHDLIAPCIKLCLQFASQYFAETELEELYLDHAFYENSELFYSFMWALTTALPENQAAISTSLEKVLIECIKGENEIHSLLATEVGINLGNRVFPYLREQKELSGNDYLEAIADRILGATSSHIITHLCPRYVVICLDMYFSGFISLSDLLQWHGTQSLFQQYHYILYDWLYLREVGPDVLSDLCDQDSNPKQRERSLKYIQEFGSTLLTTPMPWAHIKDYDNLWMMIKCHAGEVILDGDKLFGIFAILTFMHERWYESRFRMNQVNSREFETLFPEYLYWIFISRGDEEDVEPEKIEEELKKCGFSPEQREFVEQWASHQISVIAT